jgi:5'-nucleotidase
MGPLVTLGDFRTRVPYDDALFKFTITGAQLVQILRYTLRPETRAGASYFFQVNRGVQAVYNDTRRDLETLTIRGQPVRAAAHYTICLQQYHYEDTPKHFGVPAAIFTEVEPVQVVATSMRDVLEEYLGSHQNLTSAVEGRLIFTT